MKKLVKIIVYAAVALALVLAAAVVLLPHLVDVEKYKPMAEKKISAATGLAVSLGGDISLKLFPAVGLSFQDLRLANPDGFASGYFAKIDSFEAELKVMPLFSKRLEIDRFLLDGFELNLERTSQGEANWAKLAKTSARKEPKTASGDARSDDGGFRLESVDAGEVGVSNGKIIFADSLNGIKKDISELNITFVDVNLERPVMTDIRMKVDGKSFALSGEVGPVGKVPGRGRLLFDLQLDILEELQVLLKGEVRDIMSDLRYDLSLDTSDFSPRTLLSALDIELPAEPDEDAMNSSKISMSLTGSLEDAIIEKGVIKLDDSTFSFSGKSNSFAPVNIVFEGHMDSFDLDRYLPVSDKGSGKVVDSAGPVEDTPRDYRPLREITLDASMTVDELKARGGTFEQIEVQLTAQDGVFRLDPLSVTLYGGRAASRMILNVQGDVPGTDVSLDVDGVQVGPLLHDLLDKDILEGAMAVQAELSTRGDTPSAVKNSLSGGGDLRFQDGAIVGVDLAGMVRNVQSSFGFGAAGERPKTDFAELNVPFTLTNGLFHTAETSLKSPFIRVVASGSADLVTEFLDMKVHPKFVGTMTGQGDTQLRSGLMIPVIVGGTFSAPEFSPDLEEMAKSRIVEEGVKKLLGEESETETIVPVEQIDETIKKGIKSLLPSW